MSNKKGFTRNCYWCAYGGAESPRCRRYQTKPADSLCFTDNGDMWNPERVQLVELRIKRDGFIN